MPAMAMVMATARTDGSANRDCRLERDSGEDDIDDEGCCCCFDSDSDDVRDPHCWAIIPMVRKVIPSR